MSEDMSGMLCICDLVETFCAALVAIILYRTQCPGETWSLTCLFLTSQAVLIVALVAYLDPGLKSRSAEAKTRLAYHTELTLQCWPIWLNDKCIIITRTGDRTWILERSKRTSCHKTRWARRDILRFCMTLWDGVDSRGWWNFIGFVAK